MESSPREREQYLKCGSFAPSTKGIFSRNFLRIEGIGGNCYESAMQLEDVCSAGRGVHFIKFALIFVIGTLSSKIISRTFWSIVSL